MVPTVAGRPEKCFNKKRHCIALTHKKIQIKYRAIYLLSLFSIFLLLVRQIQAEGDLNNAQSFIKNTFQSMTINDDGAMKNEEIKFSTKLYDISDDAHSVESGLYLEVTENAPENGSFSQREAESPGRQLVDITVEASAGKPSESMKNGLLQRDVDVKIKIQNKSSLLNGNIISEESSASNYDKNSNLVNPQALVPSSKNDLRWHHSPLPLVSEDCNEMEMNIKNYPTLYEDRDMETNERDTTLNRKVTNLKSDALLPKTKTISHIHNNDKERRAISDDINDSSRMINDVPDRIETYTEKIAATNLKYLKKVQSANKMHIYDEDAGINSGDAKLLSEKEDPKGETAKESFASDKSTAKKDERSSAWHGRQRDRDMIRFNSGPPREKYIVPSLRFSQGTFIFRFLSGFFGFLHPFNFPTELLRDLMWNTLSVPQLILQSIRVEVGFIIAIILAIMASLVVPVYGFCCSILMLLGKKRTKMEANSPTPGLMEDDDFGGACERRILILVMQIFLLISVWGVGIMVIGNEFANNGAGLAGNGLRAAGRDLSAYLHATHRDLTHVLLDSADQTIAAANHDLDRVDVLLGEPIQKALAVETGIDVALDALADIAAASMEMSSKVEALGVEGSRAAALAVTARERLRELRRQLEVARDNCAKSDRPLCETIDTAGLDLVIRVEMLSEKRLQPLVTAMSAQNLSEAAEQGRIHFSDVPLSVANQTKLIIEDVRDVLKEKRSEITLTVERSLGKVMRHLSNMAISATRHFGETVRAIDAIEFWRWFLFLDIVVVMSLVIALLLIATFCGCCGAENYGRCLFKASVILMCLIAIPMWFLAVIVFAVGGHGEVFLCRPLYDDPEFKVLGKLLDKPGLLYKDNSGLLEDLFKNIGNVTLDQPIRNILRDCKENKPAYPVFQMRRILDVNVETAYFNWSKLEIAKEKMKNSTFSLNLATPAVQIALNDIMRRSSVNFTEYRMQLNGPITGKDLTSLADQLESIANQNSDLSTSSRIETLASRTRRVVSNSIQPLEHLRTELVYKLTELELQIQPLQRQMNQSLSHLKTIQYYIDNQGGIIAEKKIQDYVRRLTGYLEQYRGYVLNQIENHVAPCRPLWDIFDGTRSLICRHYIDSLNGFWLGLSSTLLLWIGMAPLALKLRRSYKASMNRKQGLLLRTISHQEPHQDNW